MYPALGGGGGGRGRRPQVLLGQKSETSNDPLMRSCAAPLASYILTTYAALLLPPLCSSWLSRASVLNFDDALVDVLGEEGVGPERQTRRSPVRLPCEYMLPRDAFSSSGRSTDQEI